MLSVQLPQLGYLSTGDVLENMFVVFHVLHSSVQLLNGTVPVPTLDPVEEVRRLLIAPVPIAVSFPLPMGRHVSGIQTDPVCIL